jgi:hypothetical protein
MNISNFNKLFNGHVLKWSRYYNSANVTNNLVENRVIFWINTNLRAFYMGVQGGRTNKMEQSYWSKAIIGLKAFKMKLKGDSRLENQDGS